MCVVQQSVAVETAVEAEQDGRGGRQTKELMRDTGVRPVSLLLQDQCTEDLHVLPLGLLGNIMRCTGVICQSKQEE